MQQQRQPLFLDVNVDKTSADAATVLSLINSKTCFGIVLSFFINI